MQNLGILKDILLKRLVESTIKGEINGVGGKFKKLLKENKALKELFNVFDNLESMVEQDDTIINDFIMENVKYIKQYDFDILSESVDKVHKLCHPYDINTSKNKELYEAINNLIFTEYNSKNLNEKVKNLKTVREYIKSNKAKEVREVNENYDNGKFVYNFIREFKNRYGDLDDVDLSIFESNLKGNKEELFEVLKTKSLEIINLALTEEISDLDYKGKLLATKEVLLNTNYSTEKVDEDINNFLSIIK